MECSSLAGSVATWSPNHLRSMSRGYSGCVLGFCEASRTRPFAAVAPKHSVLLAFSRSAFVCDKAIASLRFSKTRAQRLSTRARRPRNHALLSRLYNEGHVYGKGAAKQVESHMARPLFATKPLIGT